MKHVFGPVASRRLGRSLGIDPIPFKTCNWNCVYCQLGRTTPVVNHRREYVPADEIIGEIRQYLQSPSATQLDWITFIGSGEPLLNSRLGEMIRAVKAMTTVPVAVITNGSLLFLKQVREELLPADAVIPSVDAGSAALYKAVNRPFPALGFAEFIFGLQAFRREYKGKFWIESMLIKGFNDSPEAVADLGRVLSAIGPDEVQINVPVRPPAEPWIEAPEADALARALDILGAAAHVIPPPVVTVEPSGHDNAGDAILEIVERHPMSETELSETLPEWSHEEITETVRGLYAAGKLQPVTRYGRRFWSLPEARYAETRSSSASRGGQGR